MQHISLARPSFTSQLRAVWAAARKEWIIFRRYPSWIMSFVVWPVLFPIGYIFGARALGGPTGADVATFAKLAGTSDYVGFIVVGSTMWMWLNITLWDVGYQLRNEQMRGTLESNWLCPVWRIGMVLGGSLTKLGTALLLVVISAIEFRLFFGVRLLEGNVGLLLLVLLLSILSIYGIGLGFASLVLRFKEANALVFLVRGVFMIFCGISFPLAVLPGWMQSVAHWLPLTYAIRAMRAIALGGAGFADVSADLLRLALFGLALPVVGVALFALTERRSRRRGDLGQY
jgi:ABC-2 type transport system permease protein